MYKQFATVNVDRTLKHDPDAHHRIDLVFPPDERSSRILKTISFYRSFVHDFRVETSDNNASVNDIFSSMVPVGSEVQNFTVRYTVLPDRATIDLESLPEILESVHIISSSISEDDIKRVKELVHITKLSVRLTGFNKSEVKEEPFMKIGKDFILFSNRIITPDINEVVLNESDALQYILERKKYGQ